MDGLPGGDTRGHDRSGARKPGDAGPETMHGGAANAPSAVTSDGEEETAGLAHAKEHAQAEPGEEAHGQ